MNNLSFGVQTISGTGALKVGLDFLSRNGYNVFYASNPTWGNHNLMAKQTGFSVRKYRYYEASTKSIDFKGMVEDLQVFFNSISLINKVLNINCWINQAAPENAVVVLHGIAHNPSGMDLTMDEWHIISQIVKVS